MKFSKPSALLPASFSHFIDKYKVAYGLMSHVKPIQFVIKRVQQLEKHYREANKEIEPLFDITSNDGLDI